MKAIWLTDIHLNFLKSRELADFWIGINNLNPDIVVITGDIAEGNSLKDYFSLLEEDVFKFKIVYCLGNHDFYGSSIDLVRTYAKNLNLQSSKFVWVGGVNHIEITPHVALVGHDGWADARFGDFMNSRIWLADFQFITDFLGLSKTAIRSKMEELGDETARHWEKVLPEAMEKYPLVIAITHVPPFKEATWHQGKISDKNWLPFFSCKASGEALIKIAKQYPQSQLRVLCGHTHGEGYVKILPNLEVYTGHAEYKHPEIQKIFEFSD